MNGGMPGTLALMELPSRLSCDAYLAVNLHRAPWENIGRMHGETSFLPFGVFLGESSSSYAFWEKNAVASLDW